MPLRSPVLLDSWHSIITVSLECPAKWEHGMLPYTWNNVWGLCSAQSLLWNLSREGVLFSFPQSVAVGQILGSSAAGWWRDWNSEGWASSLPQSALKSVLFSPFFQCFWSTSEKQGWEQPQGSERGRGPCWCGNRGGILEKLWALDLNLSWAAHTQQGIAHCSATGSPVTIGNRTENDSGEKPFAWLENSLWPLDHKDPSPAWLGCWDTVTVSEN